LTLLSPSFPFIQPKSELPKAFVSSRVICPNTSVSIFLFSTDVGFSRLFLTAEHLGPMWDATLQLDAELNSVELAQHHMRVREQVHRDSCVLACFSFSFFLREFSVCVSAASPLD
jgi:hypothetical protein